LSDFPRNTLVNTIFDNIYVVFLLVAASCDTANRKERA